MGSAQTDKDGRFDLRGYEYAYITDPRPYLFIDKTKCHGNPEMTLQPAGDVGVSIGNKVNQFYLLDDFGTSIRTCGRDTVGLVTIEYGNGWACGFITPLRMKL
jgi:hypothetical protein